MENRIPLRLNNVVVRFCSNNLVRIENEKEDGNCIKYLSFDELCNLILASKENKKKRVTLYDTPELPGFNAVRSIKYRKVSDGTELFVISRDPVPADITYYDTKFTAVGIPKLLFAIRVFKGVMQTVYVTAVKDQIITKDSKLYHYPFSNVYGDGRVCFGSNSISELDVSDPVSLHSITEIFLRAPNNSDAYGKNLSGLEYRPLLEYLQGKEFNNDWLKPMGKTFKQWFDLL